MDKYVIRTPTSDRQSSTPSESPGTPRGPMRSNLSPGQPRQRVTPTVSSGNHRSPITPTTMQQEKIKDSTPEEVLFQFDDYSGKKWIYPNNMEVRPYQKQAVEMGLFKNAMIVLPTGLGKTFIAAVVMYNFYRWYPTGKVIFVAPTRPLVTQQMSECKKIAGIPSSECIELTGSISRDKRLVYWTTKRVFFATPQVIENDLNEGILPGAEVRCLVLDEAHRAQGGYAYVGIVRHLHVVNRNGFRVLALSATPGSDIERVKQVMLNLFISDVMFRTEQSIDLGRFKNQKNSQAWTVELPPKHRQMVEQFIKICDPIIKELYRAGLLFNANTLDKVPKYALVKAMKTGFATDAASNRISRGKMSYLVAVAMTMSNAFEYLTIYGIRVFYASITRSLEAPRSGIRTALSSSVEFTKLLDSIKAMFGEDLEINATKKATVDLMQGHPKLSSVKEILHEHFRIKQEQGQSTRVIVFTKYKDSVADIVQMLRAYEPLIKPAIFVGQSGMKQKDQIAMVKEFKDGLYNVVVATCVAEEGLDIGEVDLIICYDTTSSPISNTQRRGRTGRKRAGDVQTLCTKGYEEKKLSTAGSARRSVESSLYNRDNYIAFGYKNAPRMVPENIHPKYFEQKIFALEDDAEPEKRPKRKRVKKATTNDKDQMKKKKGCSQETDCSLSKEYSTEMEDDLSQEKNRDDPVPKVEEFQEKKKDDDDDSELEWSDSIPFDEICSLEEKACPKMHDNNDDGDDDDNDITIVEPT